MKRVKNTKKKNTRNIGKFVKTRTPLLARYGHPRTTKRSENGHFSRRIVLTLPGDLPTFSAKANAKALRDNVSTFDGTDIACLSAKRRTLTWEGKGKELGGRQRKESHAAAVLCGKGKSKCGNDWTWNDPWADSWRKVNQVYILFGNSMHCSLETVLRCFD